MAKKFNFKSKSLWKKIGIGVVAGVVGLGAIMGVGALLNKEEDTTKKITPAYEVGALTEQGDYLESKGSIYTKNAFECQGLDIEMDFKNDISYRVFFYDEDNDFLSSTPKLTENYDETTTPYFAHYARIVITPNDDDNIKWHEKNGYANQLSIEVNKEQKFEKLSENLYEFAGRGTFAEDGSVTTGNAYYCGNADVSAYDSVYLRFTVADLDLENANPSPWCKMIFEDGTSKFKKDILLEENIVSNDGTFIVYKINTKNATLLKICTTGNSILPVVNGLI